MPHFLDHSVLLRSTFVTQFLTVQCFCWWWCTRPGYHRSRKGWLSELLPQTGQDQGFDTGLSGCVGSGPLHHSPETCRPSHYWCRLSLGLLFSKVGARWMNLNQSFCQLSTFDLSQTQNTLRELCIRAHASTVCGDGTKSWVPMQPDLWSLVPCS
jgi:hypothetical protein